MSAVNFRVEPVRSLGCATLRVSQCNQLHQAVRFPSLDAAESLLWHDGSSVWTCDLKSMPSTRRADVDGVSSVSWSGDGKYASCTAAEKGEAIVWKVESGEFVKIACKKLISSPLYSTWHPSRPLVAVLSSRGVLDVFRVTDADDSVETIFHSDCAGRAVWKDDESSSLYVAERERYLCLVPIEVDGDASVKELATFDSAIRSLVALDSKRVALTTDQELNPTDSCNLFDVNLPLPPVRRSDPDDVLRPTDDNVRHSMTRFQRRKHSASSAILAVVSVINDETAAKVCGQCPLPGVLTPDLLCFDSRRNHFVCGSNTLHILYVVQLTTGVAAAPAAATVVPVGGIKLELISKITLDKLERPKGLLCLSSQVGSLIMVGKFADTISMTSVSTSPFVEYDVHLAKVAVAMTEEEGLEKLIPHVNGGGGGGGGGEGQLKLPGGREGPTVPLIVELPSPQGVDKDYDDNDDDDVHMTQRELIEVKETLRAQSREIQILKNRLDGMLTSSSSLYPTMDEAELMEIICCNLPEGSKQKKKKKSFLLDAGRLKLDVILQAFELFRAEIVIGSAMVPLTADESGYVPLQFKKGQVIFIRAVETINKKISE